MTWVALILFLMLKAMNKLMNLRKKEEEAEPEGEPEPTKEEDNGSDDENAEVLQNEYYIEIPQYVQETNYYFLKLFLYYLFLN